jgi:signal transduction histidine kinase
VLNYAKLETGTVHFELEPVGVRGGARRGGGAGAPQAQARGLALHVADCPPELRVYADAEKLRQILVNLLSNAVKFTDRGGRIEAGRRTIGVRVHLTVRDTGVGISADQLRSIFDPFVQVRAESDTYVRGRGAGARHQP